jgi:hypothetical protein
MQPTDGVRNIQNMTTAEILRCSATSELDKCTDSKAFGEWTGVEGDVEILVILI